jgi:hypothetical protein
VIDTTLYSGLPMDTTLEKEKQNLQNHYFVDRARDFRLSGERDLKYQGHRVDIHNPNRMKIPGAKDMRPGEALSQI